MRPEVVRRFGVARWRDGCCRADVEEGVAETGLAAGAGAIAVGVGAGEVLLSYVAASTASAKLLEPGKNY